jgi:CRP-like cAMP-binding protein
MPDAARRLVSPVERLLYLKSLPTLSGLPAAELASLADRAVERFFSKGAVLLREGRAVNTIYLVVEGVLAVRRRGRFVTRVGPGAGVGGLGLFARDPEGAQVLAEEDTLTLELDSDTLLEVLEDRFPVLLHIVRDIARQVVDLITRLRLDPNAGAAPFQLPVDPSRELDLVERIFFLRKVPVFERASINALAELSRQTTQVRFAPGITLWHEGDPAPGIYLVLSGTIRARSEARGLDFRFGAGSAVGAVEATADLPRFYDAVTETEVVALQGNSEALIDVFEDNFEMAMDYLAVLARFMLRVLEARLPLEGRTL